MAGIEQGDKTRYDAAVTGFNTSPIPVAPDIPSWMGDISSILRRGSDVSLFASTIRGRLSSYSFENVESRWDFDQLVIQANAAASSVKRFWESRQTKIEYIVAAREAWFDWNSKVKRYFLTGLVSNSKGAMLSVPYGDNAKHDITDHRFLLGMFSKVSAEKTFGSDGNAGSTSAGEAANAAVDDALSKAATQVQEIFDACNSNVSFSESRSFANAVTEHETAVQTLRQLLQDIERIDAQKRTEWTTSYDVTVGDNDVEGGAGS